MDQEATPIDSSAGCFAFAGVELDAARISLRVDGQLVHCSRKAFELLLQLCLVSNRVQSRDELIAALWPGGQIVSDEALTQVIFRARAVLGRHASALLTVRGVGLRLGVAVTRRRHDRGDALQPSGKLPDVDSSVHPTGNAGATAALPETTVFTGSLVALGDAPLAPASIEPSSRGRRPWLIPLAAMLVLMVSATIVGLQRAPAPAVELDDGYGLLETDLHGSDPRTATWIRDALKNDAQGDRDRGEALLQAVHNADSTTPIPAIVLALWASGNGKGERAEEWLALASQRAQPLHDVYVNLLLAYVAAEVSDTPDAVLRQAGALLDIRPQAWRMHLARAHLMVIANLRTAALHEIQQIDVPALGNRKLEMVIADRASLGDVTGAQAMLDRLPQRDDAAQAYLRGRIAWSRGDFDAAYIAYLRCAESSGESARLDLRRRALTGMAAVDVMHDRDEAAMASLEQARVGAGAAANSISDFDISLFLAELHARAGNRAAMNSELDRALAAAATIQSSEFQMIAALVAARLRPSVDVPAPAHMDAIGEALWRARGAWNRGQRDAARLALTDADRRGVLNTRLVEEARFLAWQIGQPVAAEAALDPPFPPLAVVVLRRDLRQALAAAGH